MTAAGSVVFRRTTVITMDDERSVLADADLLVVDDRIVDIGPRLAVPHDAVEIDGTDGVLVPKSSAVPIFDSDKLDGTSLLKGRRKRLRNPRSAGPTLTNRTARDK